MCWLSVGGDLDDLTRLWTRDDQQLSTSERLVVGVLKEKIGVSLASQATDFVSLTTTVAAACAAATL